MSQAECDGYVPSVYFVKYKMTARIIGYKIRVQCELMCNYYNYYTCMYIILMRQKSCAELNVQYPVFRNNNGIS